MLTTHTRRAHAPPSTSEIADPVHEKDTATLAHLPGYAGSASLITA